MRRISGLKLLDEREGAGTLAKKGDRVVYNTKIFLNQGDEVPLNDLQAKQLPKEMVRVEAESHPSFTPSYLAVARRSPVSSMR